MFVLADAARDTDADVTYTTLVQFASGFITKVELNYKLACLILEEGKSPDLRVTKVMAEAFDAYRGAIEEGMRKPRLPSEWGGIRRAERTMA